MILKRQLQRKFDNMKSGHSEFNVEDMSSVSSNEESNGNYVYLTPLVIYM